MIATASTASFPVFLDQDAFKHFKKVDGRYKHFIYVFDDGREKG